ncbi:hypothetical protein NFJ02_05g120770 [Pycnococcus provasolii]
MAAMAAPKLLPLSLSAHLSRFRVLRSERSTRASAAQSRFSAISRRFSSSDKSCFRGISGNHGSFAEKHSGFGLGVRRGDYFRLGVL